MTDRRRSLLLSALMLAFLTIALDAQPLTNPILLEANPGTQGALPYKDVLGNVLYLNGEDISTGKAALWKIDAAAASPIPVRIKSFSIAGPIRNSWGTLFLRADDGSGKGQELFKSNGTAAGTVLVKDILTSKQVPSSAPYTFLPYPGGKTVFLANGETRKGVSAGSHYGMREICITDGTANGTMVLSKSKAYDPSEGTLTVWQGNIYGMMWDAANKYGVELWKSNGSTTGTVMLKDINPGPNWSFLAGNSIGLEGGIKSYAARMVPLEDFLYFVANDETNGYELWRTDGTTAGTQLAVDIFPGPEWGYPSWMVTMNGYLYFAARNADDGDKLMRYKPSSGIQVVADINPGTGPSDSSRIRALTVVGSTLMFSADDGEHGSELWVSDGNPVTLGGQTHIVADIFPGAGSSNPFVNVTFEPYHTVEAMKWSEDFGDDDQLRRWSFKQANGWIYFPATDGTNGVELYRSNGSIVQWLSDVNQDPYDQNKPGGQQGSTGAWHITIVNNRLFFLGYHPTTGYEYYMIDNLSSLPKATQSGEVVPTGLSLEQNYPNPFNPSTMIEFVLPSEAQTRLTVHDMLGREVAVLFDEVRPAGTQRVSYHVSNLPSGNYVYRFEADGHVLTRMMTLVK